MFHSHGKPLKKWSLVIWSVRDIHNADISMTNEAMMAPHGLCGSMKKRSMNITGMTMHVTKSMMRSSV